MSIQNVPRPPQPQYLPPQEIVIFGIIPEGWCLIGYVLLLSFFASGCSATDSTISDRAAELSSGFARQVATLDSKQDKAISEIGVNRAEAYAHTQQILEKIESLEASLVKSEPQQLGGDPADIEPQKAASTPQPLPLEADAMPSAVRLFVTHAPFHCPPCERLKAAVANGEFDGFEVSDSEDFPGLRSYPAIRFETPSSSSGWGVLYGYDNTTIPQLRALTQGTSGPLTGTIFPLPRPSAILNSGPVVRSVSRWIGYDRRPRIKARKSCPAGGCS